MHVRRARDAGRRPRVRQRRPQRPRHRPVSHTDLHTGGGDDRVYVSSLADVPLTGAGSRRLPVRRPVQIDGTLNLDFGTGRHTLLVSDEAGLVGPTALITGDQVAAAARDGRVTAGDRRRPRPRAPASAIYLLGLAGRAITYNAPRPATSPTASGSGPATATTPLTVERHRQTAGVRTITWLNTGLGNDDVTVNLSPAKDGFFVLDTQGPNENVRTVHACTTATTSAAGDVVRASPSAPPRRPGRYVVNAGAAPSACSTAACGPRPAGRAITLSVLRTFVQTAVLAAEDTARPDDHAGGRRRRDRHGQRDAPRPVTWSGQTPDLHRRDAVTGLVVVELARTVVGDLHRARRLRDRRRRRRRRAAAPRRCRWSSSAARATTGSHGGTGGDIVFGDRGRVLWFARAPLPIGFAGRLAAGDLATLEGAAAVRRRPRRPGDKTDGVAPPGRPGDHRRPDGRRRRHRGHRRGQRHRPRRGGRRRRRHRLATADRRDRHRPRRPRLRRLRLLDGDPTDLDRSGAPTRRSAATTRSAPAPSTLTGGVAACAGVSRRATAPTSSSVAPAATRSGAATAATSCSATTAASPPYPTRPSAGAPCRCRRSP